MNRADHNQRLRVGQAFAVRRATCPPGPKAALEAQLDLVFAYTQWGLARNGVAEVLTLYRGTNHAAQYERLEDGGGVHDDVLLFNNLTSLSASHERADEFGDVGMAAQVPATKVFFHGGLLPGRLAGEEEYLVIGGLHRVSRAAKLPL